MRTALTLFAALPFTLHAQLPPTLAHYPLHGNTYDVSGHAFHGVAYGATFGPGPYGEANTALVLDGNDHVDLSLAAIAYRGALDAASITFWVKFSDPVTNGQTVLSLGTFGENINTNVNEITYDADVLGLRTEITGIDHDHELDATIEADTWYHMAVVLDGTMATYYRDGVEQRSFTYTPAETSTTNLFLGCFAGNTGEIGRYLHGSVSDLRLYGAVLDAQDVEDVFNGITAWINDEGMPLSMMLFPNPSTDMLRLRMERTTVHTTYRILSSEGRLVREARIMSTIEHIDVSTLPNSIYHLQVLDAQGAVAQCVFIKN